jgi:hypothetical protein
MGEEQLTEFEQWEAGRLWGVSPRETEAEPKVVCSLRRPVDVYQRLRDLAVERGVKPTALMRDWVVAGLPPPTATGPSRWLTC